MTEKMDNQSAELSFFDLVAQDVIEFAEINDCVLDSGMSTMTMNART